MAQAAAVQKTDETAGPTAFNLMKWIAENPDKLKPPLGAKTIFREDDFMVTVVGGPERAHRLSHQPDRGILLPAQGHRQGAHPASGQAA